MDYCRSQSYDGAANMRGAKSGVATRIQSIHPDARYYYCMNHDLNLAVSKASKIQEMHIMLDTVK